MGEILTYAPYADYIDDTGVERRLWTCDDAWTLEQAERQFAIWEESYHYNLIDCYIVVIKDFTEEIEKIRYRRKWVPVDEHE